MPSPADAQQDAMKKIAKEVNESRFNRISLLVDIYRRCQNELNTATVMVNHHSCFCRFIYLYCSYFHTIMSFCFVKSRSNALRGYVTGMCADVKSSNDTVSTSSATPSSSVSSQKASVRFNINKLISNVYAPGAVSALFSKLGGSEVSTGGTTQRSVSPSSNRIGAFTDEVKSLHLSPSDRWHNHIWYALTGKSWEAYQSSRVAAEQATAVLTAPSPPPDMISKSFSSLTLLPLTPLLIQEEIDDNYAVLIRQEILKCIDLSISR